MEARFNHRSRAKTQRPASGSLHGEDTGALEFHALGESGLSTAKMNERGQSPTTIRVL